MNFAEAALVSAKTKAYVERYKFLEDENYIKNLENKKADANAILQLANILQGDIFPELKNRVIGIRNPDDLRKHEWIEGDILIILIMDQTHTEERLVLMHYRDEANMLFKDCTGKIIPKDLTQTLSCKKKESLKSNLICSDYDHLLTIMNVACIANIDTASFDCSREFAQGDDDDAFLNSLVTKLRVYQLRNNISNELKEIENCEVFKSALNKFVKETVRCVDLAPMTTKLMDIIDKEVTNFERNGTIDMTGFEQARDDLIKEIEPSSDPHTKQPMLDEQFPKEMTHFQNIFEMLKDYKVDEKFMSAIQLISDRLGINYNDMEKFYEKQLQQNESETSKEILETSGKNEGEKQYTNYNNIARTDLLIMDMQLIKEVQILNNFSEEQASALFQLLSKTIDIFNEDWHNKTSQDIMNWTKRNKKDKVCIDVDDQLCETLAICIRAYEVCANINFTLRNVQILASLILLTGSKGSFAEILTGEGKTYIVAIVAVLQVLAGKQVDIITSNEVLADAYEELEEFYDLFDIQVGTNNHGAVLNNAPRACYTYDIVYGTIANFQFDYLLDFFEGQGTRKERRFDFLILDEADSLTMDCGGNIAKLAQPFPGIEYLQYVYIHIWKLVHKADLEFALQIEFDDPNDFNSVKRDTFIKKYVLDANPLDNLSMVPLHLHDYCQHKLEKWVDNAIRAKYHCHEFQDYVLKQRNPENNEDFVIAPVDYANSGIVLKNTMWANALHQFVQLKHQLVITSDTLTASYISNQGYVSLYHSNIYGVTGTLGSKPEQDFLSSVYDLSYTKIPSFKPKQFTEIPTIVMNDAEWCNAIAFDAVIKIKEKRSILIICETIKDAQEISNEIKELISKISTDTKPNIREYFDETFAKSVLRDIVEICEIIVATNISGRGTDFKFSSELNANGGLHVCVTFPPCNERVEQQAFGRTSRSGNPGTGQLIIKRSKLSCPPTTEEIKRARDANEKDRLEKLHQETMKKVQFEDALFTKFELTYREFRQLKQTDADIMLLHDLKETWAFWLDQHEFKGTEDIEKEYEKFLKTVSPILQERHVMTNPFYVTKQANYFIDNKEFDAALEVLTKMLKTCENQQADQKLLYPLFDQLATTYLYKGDGMNTSLKGTLRQLTAEDGNEEEIPNDNSKYKIKAIEVYKRSLDGVNFEVDYMRTHIIENDYLAFLFTNANEDGSESKQHALSSYIQSRFTTFKWYSSELQKLCEKLELEGDVAICSTSTFGHGDNETHPNVRADFNNLGITGVVDVCKVTALSQIWHGASRLLGGLALTGLRWISNCVLIPIAIAGTLMTSSFSLIQYVVETILSSLEKRTDPGYFTLKAIQICQKVVESNVLGYLAKGAGNMYISIVNFMFGIGQFIWNTIQSSGLLRGATDSVLSWMQISRADLGTYARNIYREMLYTPMRIQTALKNLRVSEIFKDAFRYLFMKWQALVERKVKTVVGSKLTQVVSTVSEDTLSSELSILRLRQSQGNYMRNIRERFWEAFAQLSIKNVVTIMQLVKKCVSIETLANDYCSEIELALAHPAETITNDENTTQDSLELCGELITADICFHVQQMCIDASCFIDFAAITQAQEANSNQIINLDETYAILELTTDASIADVEQAFYKLSQLHHPNGPEPDQARFAAIRRAYRSIRDLEEINNAPSTSGDNNLVSE